MTLWYHNDDLTQSFKNYYFSLLNLYLRLSKFSDNMALVLTEDVKNLENEVVLDFFTDQGL